jgi:hypothetical protein
MIGLTVFPLVVDAYTRQTLSHANQPPLANNLGVLDSRGRATATLTIPPPTLPDAIGGLTLDHAVAVWAAGEDRPLATAAVLVSTPRRVQMRLPPEVLFSEDFEDALTGWTVTSDGTASWHLAEDGECGATSRMAVLNEASTCSFTPGAPVESRLVSPSFVLNDISPFTIEFDMIRDFAAGTMSTVRVEFVDESTSNTLVTQELVNYQLTNGEWGTGLVHVRLQMPQSSKFEGRTVHLEFAASSGEPAAGTGWLVDNITITDYGALPERDRP